jgi:hypothetical protein
MEPLRSTRHAELLRSEAFKALPTDLRESFLDVPIQEAFGQRGQRMRFEVNKLRPGSVGGLPCLLACLPCCNVKCQ